jgi:hypothetical protein
MSQREIADLIKQWPRLSLAVAGGYGGLVPIDVDVIDREIIRAVGSALPFMMVSRVGSKGFMTFFRGDAIEACKFVVPGGKPIVEVLTTGAATIPPSWHPKIGKPYRWSTRRTLYDTPLMALPVIDPEHILALAKALVPWVPEKKPYEPPQADESAPPTEDKRMRAYAETILRSAAKDLATMNADSGRNRRLFEKACQLGRYAHHGVLARSEIESALMEACTLNGLTSEDGPENCLATLESGLKRARNDTLPVLPEREKRFFGSQRTTNGLQSDARE